MDFASENILGCMHGHTMHLARYRRGGSKMEVSDKSIMASWLIRIVPARRP